LYKQFVDPIIRSLFLCLGFFLLFFSIKITIVYIYPFLIAFIIAALLNPTVSFLEQKWKMPRGLATLSVISFIFLLFFGILLLLINEIIQGTAYLLKKLPDYFQIFIKMMEEIFHNHILPSYQKIAAYFQSLDPSHQTTIQDKVEEFLENIADTGTSMIQTAINQLPEIVGFFPNSLTITIFILLATFIITKDWHQLTKKLSENLPDNVLSFIYDIHVGIKKAFSGYLRAQFILIFISAVIIFIGLVFIKVPHALAIAAIAALVDLLPIIGTGIIFVPWIIYTFITGEFSLTISLSILYMVVIITRQVIEPKILSANIGINPLVSLITLFVTIQLWGMIGVIIAPILLILVYVVFQSGILKMMVQFIKG
jgi:sporulation integral membrane protein YtvI